VCGTVHKSSKSGAVPDVPGQLAGIYRRGDRRGIHVAMHTDDQLVGVAEQLLQSV